MDCYALTVLFNGPINLECLKRIQDHGLIPAFFDNSTNVEIQQKNEKYCKEKGLIYETQHGNSGLPIAYNSILKKYITPEDWIIIFDQDTPLPDEYFSKAEECRNSGKALTYMPFFKLFRPGKYGPNVIRKVSTFKIYKNHSTQHMRGYLLGINSCTLFSGKVFEKIGYFNEDLLLDYVDDDIFFRMAAAGIQSETIDIVMTQNFFTNARNPLKKILKRFRNIKRDGRVFFGAPYFKKPLNKFLYLKEMLKFEIKFALKNNMFYFFPLLFCRPKAINK